MDLANRAIRHVAEKEGGKNRGCSEFDEEAFFAKYMEGLHGL